MAAHQRVLARLSEHVELVRLAAADRAGRRLHRPEAQTAALEDTRVGRVHHVVLAFAVGVVGVERVRVLHQELAPAHEAEARTDLVAELRLHLIKRLRQLAVGADLAPHDVGDDLLVRRAEAEVPIVAILDAQQFLAVLLPTPAFLPELRRADDRHQQLLGAGAVHLLAYDPLDLAHDAQSERQEIVNAAGDLAYHAGAHHQLVADDFRIGGIFLQRRDERTREAHGDSRDLTGCSPQGSSRVFRIVGEDVFSVSRHSPWKRAPLLSESPPRCYSS